MTDLGITNNFGAVIARDPATGHITVHLSDTPPEKITVMTRQGPMQLVPIAPGQANTPGLRRAEAATAAQAGVIESSPTAKAFDPANAMVLVGVVQLNKASQYLTDLPDAAKAEFLVSPKSTAKIFGRGLGTWNEDTASVRGIDASHGIHFDGQALAGMQIFDRPRNATGVTYEEALAKEIRAAWEQANATGEAVTTGLAIGTKELVHGRKVGSSDVTVRNNLYSCVNDVNAAIVKQGGEKILTKRGSDSAFWQFTASEHPDDRALVYSVVFTFGVSYWVRKFNDLSSSRPVALRILAPNP